MQAPVFLGMKERLSVLIADFDLVVLELLELFNVVELNLSDFPLLLFWDDDFLVLFALGVTPDHNHFAGSGPILVTHHVVVSAYRQELVVGGVFGASGAG